MRQSKKSGEFIIPGEPMGVIEEFVAGSGTYMESGTIYSEITGCTLLDMQNKEVSVYPLVHTVLVPRTGNTVVGQVSDLQNKLATLRMWRVETKKLPNFFTGVLHVSDASLGFVRTMFDVCRTGDIMRAKVVSEKNGMYHLSLAETDLGVIYAFCSRCGDLMPLRERRIQCTACGKVEKRKIASDYGKAEI